MADDGAGFDPAYAGRLFEAFQRLHPEAEFEGNGIGLATVQHIVHRHRGTMWAKGAVGQVATFYFLVHAGLRKKAPVRAREPMGTSLHVLVVEDSEGDTMLLVRQLRQDGYDPVFQRVETAPTMKEALENLEWDLVIADHSLPQFSALAALKVLQNSGLDLPFIIVSGAIGEEVAVAAMKAGAHDYVMKGNLARLAAAIERELRAAQVRQARRIAENEDHQVRQELEQRVRELTALNRLFQEHLAQRFDVARRCYKLHEELQRLVQEASSLAAHAQSQLAPEPEDFRRLYLEPVTSRPKQ